MLKYRVSSKFLPKSLASLDQSLEDTSQIISGHRVIDKDMSAMITSRRHKLIGQFKLDMMAINISTAEATVRGHASIAREEKEKLLSTNDNNTDNIINAIQARQANIIQRAQYVQQCRMSFFDETPTMIN